MEYCPHCGNLPRLKANYGQFFWACDCPPPQTYTADNTSDRFDAADMTKQSNPSGDRKGEA